MKQCFNQLINLGLCFALFLLASGCTSSGASIVKPSQSPKDTSQSDFSLKDQGKNSLVNGSDRIGSLRETVHGQVNSVALIASSTLRKVRGEIADLWGTASEGNSETEETVSQKEKGIHGNNVQSLGAEMMVAQGALWETSGDLEKALDYYNMALCNEPNNLSALASMARLKMRQESYPDACKFFESAIEQSPSDAALHNDLGLARAKSGDTEGAIAAIGKAVELAPGKSRFANNLANVMFDAGDKANAFATLGKNNSPAVANFNMAYLYFRGGDYALAKQHLREVIRHEPESMHDLGAAQAVARSREMLIRIDSEFSKLTHTGKKPDSYAERIVGGDYATNVFPPGKATVQTISPIVSSSIELDNSDNLKSSSSMPVISEDQTTVGKVSGVSDVTSRSVHDEPRPQVFPQAVFDEKLR